MTNAQLAILAVNILGLVRSLIQALDEEGINEAELTPEVLEELRAFREQELERAKRLAPVPEPGAVAGE